MTNDEIKKIQERARKHARARGYSQHADDFAQEAIIKLLADRRATIDQLFIDFLRHEYGDTRSPGGRGRSRANHTRQSLDEPQNGKEDGLSLHELIAGPGGDTNSERGNWKSRVNLRGRDALIFEMRFDLEMSELEIAEALGVTESRICQLLNGRIDRAAKDAVVLQEVASLYHDDEDYSKLEIKWIAI